MTDLLDVERTEGDPSGFCGTATGNLHSKDLQRFKEVEDDAVVDRKRLRGFGPPVRSDGSALEKWEAVGIEERSTVGRQMHCLVLNSGVNNSKSREKAGPGVMPAFQDFLTVL